MKFPILEIGSAVFLEEGKAGVVTSYTVYSTTHLLTLPWYVYIRLYLYSFPLKYVQKSCVSSKIEKSIGADGKGRPTTTEQRRRKGEKRDFLSGRHDSMKAEGEALLARKKRGISQAVCCKSEFISR